MYLIKNIYLNHEKNVIVENGLRIAKHPTAKNKALIFNTFWGNSEAYLGYFVNISQFPKSQKTNASYMLMPYTSEFFVKDIGDNFKSIVFSLSTYEPDKIEGYLIFIKNGLNIKTNGEKLFGRYPNEIVALLKDNEYLEFSGRKIEVINNKLVLLI